MDTDRVAASTDSTSAAGDHVPRRPPLLDRRSLRASGRNRAAPLARDDRQDSAAAHARAARKWQDLTGEPFAYDLRSANRPLSGTGPWQPGGNRLELGLPPTDVPIRPPLAFRDANNRAAHLWR